jgi:transcriptional regulator with GAF, ATPase, and Fis domain
MSSLKDKVREIEKEAIINALKECNWVMVRAAKSLGITERMIGYKMEKYGIRRGRMKNINDLKKPNSKREREYEKC